MLGAGCATGSSVGATAARLTRPSASPGGATPRAGRHAPRGPPRPPVGAAAGSHAPRGPPRPARCDPATETRRPLRRERHRTALLLRSPYLVSPMGSSRPGTILRLSAAPGTATLVFARR